MPRRCVRPCPWASGKSSRPTGSYARTPRCQSLPPALRQVDWARDRTTADAPAATPSPGGASTPHPRSRAAVHFGAWSRRTTVREIATIADISIGTITYHFESVDEILAEVLRDSSKRFTERVISEARHLSRGDAAVGFLIDTDLPDSRHRWRNSAPLTRVLGPRAIHDPQLAVVHSGGICSKRGVIEEIIARASHPVNSSSGTRPRSPARGFLGCSRVSGCRYCLGDVQMPVESARRLLKPAACAAAAAPAPTRWKLTRRLNRTPVRLRGSQCPDPYARPAQPSLVRRFRPTGLQSSRLATP
jgi:AcrR family transcriptional regulator